MRRIESNQFQFVNAGREGGMTVLNAVMSDFSYADHAHEEFALGVTLAGVQDFSCHGSKFRSLPGEIVLLNPGDVHNGSPGNDLALKYTMLYLDPRELHGLMESAGAVGRGELRIAETHFSDPVLRASILEMGRLVSGTGCAAMEYEHCLYELAARLTWRAGLFRPDAWTAGKDALLLRAREFIHDNIAGDLSVEDLSRVANLSKFHFIRLFRSQFGLTPHRYVLNHRINLAREALRRGTPPSDVAQELGFFDASHLNRHFKRTYGVTPKQYQHQVLRED